MTRAARFTALAAAAVLGLAACSAGESTAPTGGTGTAPSSSQVSGTGSAGTTSTGTSGSATTTTGSASGTTTTQPTRVTPPTQPTGTGSSTAGGSSAPITDEPTGDAVPTELDTTSVTWFDELCQGLQPITALDPGSLADASDPQAQKAAAIQALSQLATEVGDLAGRLEGTPPPAIEGGATLAADLIAGLRTASQALSEGSAALDGIDAADANAQSELATVIDESLGAAYQPLEALDGVSPEVTAAASAIPSCAALGG